MKTYLLHYTDERTGLDMLERILAKGTIDRVEEEMVCRLADLYPSTNYFYYDPDEEPIKTRETDAFRITLGGNEMALTEDGLIQNQSWIQGYVVRNPDEIVYFTTETTDIF